MIDFLVCILIFLLGELSGVVLMCLLQISKLSDERIENKKYEKKGN